MFLFFYADTIKSSFKKCEISDVSIAKQQQKHQIKVRNNLIDPWGEASVLQKKINNNDNKWRDWLQHPSDPQRINDEG